MRRILNPLAYHMIRAEKRWQALLRREVLRWLDPLEEEKSEDQIKELKSQLEERLPDLRSLLSGAIQPTDFVKRWIEVSEETGADEEISPGSERGGELQSRGAGTPVQLNNIRRVFDLAVMREDIFLNAWRRAILDRQRYQVYCLLGLNIAILAALLWFGVVQIPYNPIAALSDLGFTSVLLVSPIVSLFFRSRMLHVNHLRERDVHRQRTRLSAAMHAYETYEEIQRIQNQKGKNP